MDLVRANVNRLVSSYTNDVSHDKSQKEMHIRITHALRERISTTERLSEWVGGGRSPPGEVCVEPGSGNTKVWCGGGKIPAAGGDHTSERCDELLPVCMCV